MECTGAKDCIADCLHRITPHPEGIGLCTRPCSKGHICKPYHPQITAPQPETQPLAETIANLIYQHHTDTPVPDLLEEDCQQCDTTIKAIMQAIAASQQAETVATREALKLGIVALKQLEKYDALSETEGFALTAMERAIALKGGR